jgi:hypothetical protein
MGIDHEELRQLLRGEIERRRRSAEMTDLGRNHGLAGGVSKEAR